MPRQYTEDRVVLEELLEQHEDEGANDRSRQRAHAAQDHHHHDRARLVPRDDLGIDEAELRCRQIARQPGQHAGQHIDAELIAHDRKTDGAHAVLIDPDALQRPAEARVEDSAQQQVDDDHQHQHQVVKRRAVVQIEQLDLAPAHQRFVVQIQAV